LLGKTDLPRVVETRQLWDEGKPTTIEELAGDEQDEPAGGEGNGGVTEPPPEPGTGPEEL